MFAEPDRLILGCACFGLGVSGGAVGYALGLLLDDQHRRGLGRPAARSLLGNALALTIGFFALMAVS
jgi:hypothetical protein